jgi:hypothetical protein
MNTRTKKLLGYGIHLAVLSFFYVVQSLLLGWWMSLAVMTLSVSLTWLIVIAGKWTQA